MPTASALPTRGDPSSLPISHFPFPLSERDLSRLWRDQTFPPEALVTSSGERLRVIYRGRPGGGAGPDFRDAVIATRGGLLQGDVELHVRSSDFHRHGHDRDPGYAGVVLHLVFRDDAGGLTALAGGGSAAVVALGDWARGRAAEIERWLERPALWREPCFSSRSRLGIAEVEAALERLGDMRFRQKAATFAKRLREMGNEKWEGGGQTEVGRGKEDGGDGRDVRLLPSSFFLLPGAEQVLWEALLEALAYGVAREEFGLLARRLPWAELRGRLAPLPVSDRAAEAWRLLAGAAGAFAFTRRGGGRPAGRPEPRLRGAAQLAARFTEGGLVLAFVDLLEGGSPRVECGETPNRKAKTENRGLGAGTGPGASEPDARAASRLVAVLTVPRLIGRSRAVEMAGNAVLPWLAAIGPEARTRRAEAVYRRLPLPARYGAVRHLHEAVGSAANQNGRVKTESHASRSHVSGFGFHGREDPTNGGDQADRHDRPGIGIDFRRQQGMLYLLNQYCTQGGCGRCPLS